MEVSHMVDIRVGAGTKVYDSEGRLLSQRDLHAPSLRILTQLALAPRLTRQGDFGLYLLVTLLAGLNLFQICHPGVMFRLSLWGHVKDRDSAEPSEFYLVMEKVEWIFLTIVAAVFYWMALTTIN